MVYTFLGALVGALIGFFIGGLLLTVRDIGRPEALPVLICGAAGAVVGAIAAGAQAVLHAIRLLERHLKQALPPQPPQGVTR
jgi:hypothetical protein